MKLKKNKCNKKVLLNSYSTLKKKIRKIRMIFDIGNSLWKSNFSTFWQDLAPRIGTNWKCFVMGQLNLTTSPWSVLTWNTLMSSGYILIFCTYTLTCSDQITVTLFGLPKTVHFLCKVKGVDCQKKIKSNLLNRKQFNAKHTQS